MKAPRLCSLCEGTGERLRRVSGGFVSDLVACFACRGTGQHAALNTTPETEGDT